MDNLPAIKNYTSVGEVNIIITQSVIVVDVVTSAMAIPSDTFSPGYIRYHTVHQRAPGYCYVTGNFAYKHIGSIIYVLNLFGREDFLPCCYIV